MSVDNKELEAFRLKARAWLQENMQKGHGAVRGHGSETADDVARERQLMAKIYDAGFAGITVPTEYGGQGLTREHQRVFSEEAAGYHIPTGGVTVAIVMPTLLKHGTEEQKRQYIPHMLRGEHFWAQLFSEPGAGSDLAGVQTKAEKQGDEWVINGQKVWSTGAAHAQYGICLTRTDWDAVKHQGLTFFIVPLDAEGVTVRPIREINGGASFCEEFLDNVRVPETNMVGGLGEGWTVANYLLSIERGGGDEPADEEMRGNRTVELSPDLVAYAKKRGLEKDGATRQLIAKAHINDYMYDTMVGRVSQAISLGKANPTHASVIKLGLGLLQPLRASIAMEVAGAGAIAWSDDQEAEEITSTQYLNGRVHSIAGGSSQIQRNIISERILGLPREPAFDRGISFREVQKRAKNWTGKGSA